MPAFVATDPVGYEKFVGRWSQRLAPLFVKYAGVTAGERVLDVGCGTGNLTAALAGARVAAATGIDLSASYIEYARRRVTDRAVVFEVGDALNLPYPDGTFDRALSMLALDVLRTRTGPSPSAPRDAAGRHGRSAGQRLSVRLHGVQHAMGYRGGAGPAR